MENRTVLVLVMATLLVMNLRLFYAINAPAIVLNPARLDEGDGIENTPTRNSGKFHQSCRLLFNNTKLERAQKKTSTAAANIEENSSKRQRTSQHSQASSMCILCDSEAPISALKWVMTMKLNERLNQCARNLSSGKLLPKFIAGDAVAQELSCLLSSIIQQRARPS